MIDKVNDTMFITHIVVRFIVSIASTIAVLVAVELSKMSSHI